MHRWTVDDVLVGMLVVVVQQRESNVAARIKKKMILQNF